MNSINLKAHAKLNLSLNVLSQIKGGYHQVKFLNCELNLADEIKIKKLQGETNKSKEFYNNCKGETNKSKEFYNNCEGETNKSKEFYNNCGRNDCRILIKCKWQENDCYDTSCPENCLAYRAAKLLQKKFPKKIRGIEITINKKIPARVGLGGGSADGAAVLFGINRLYNLRLSCKKLINLASKISSDACYSIVGGLCKVEGIGEKVMPLKIKKANKSPFYPLFRKGGKGGIFYPSFKKERSGGILSKYFLVIVVPKIKKSSTTWVYKNLDKKKIGKNLDKFEKLVFGITINDQKLAISNLHNDFEFFILSHFPEVKKIKEDLLTKGAENAILAGSGLSVAGFFKEKNKAKKAFKRFKNKFKDIFLTKIR